MLGRFQPRGGGGGGGDGGCSGGDGEGSGSHGGVGGVGVGGGDGGCSGGDGEGSGSVGGVGGVGGSGGFPRRVGVATATAAVARASTSSSAASAGWRRRRGVIFGGVGGLAARGLSARPNPRSRRGFLPRGPDTRNRTSNPDSWVLPRRTTIGGETHFTVPVKGRATPMGNRARYGRAAQRRWPNKKALGQRGHTF